MGVLFWQFLVLAPAGGDPGDAALLSASRGLGPGLLMAMMAGSPLLALANLGMGGLCWWGSVALVGAGRDFTPAWRIFCYAQAGMVLGLIPFFGMLVAGIWILALMYSGVKQVYGISAGGSLGALAVFLLLQTAAGPQPFTGPGAPPWPSWDSCCWAEAVGAAWASRRFRLILKPWANQPITAPTTRVR